MNIYAIVFRQENHKEFYSTDFYSTTELAESYLMKIGYIEKNNCEEYIRPIKKNGNKTYDEWAVIFKRNLVSPIIPILDCLDYEIRSSWWAPWISLDWAQKLAGEYFSWKIKKKYARYKKSKILQQQIKIRL